MNDKIIESVTIYTPGVEPIEINDNQIKKINAKPYRLQKPINPKQYTFTEAFKLYVEKGKVFYRKIQDGKLFLGKHHEHVCISANHYFMDIGRELTLYELESIWYEYIPEPDLKNRLEIKMEPLTIEIPYQSPESKISKKTGKRYTIPYNGLPISDNKWCSSYFKWWDKKEYKEKWNYCLCSKFSDIECIRLDAPLKIEFTIYKCGIENDTDNLRTKEITDIILTILGFVEWHGKKLRVKDDKSVLPERAQVETIPVKHRNEQKTIIAIEQIGKSK